MEEDHSQQPKVLLQEKVDNIQFIDEKILFLIDKMKEALSQEKSPDYKTFWDAKHLCLHFFKENLQPAVRAHLWSDYIELSEEARRLKDILDEQAAFAVEQIEIAIKALETDLKSYDLLVQQLPEIDFPQTQHLEKKRDYYVAIQKELNLLNTFAARINSLRKEVIKMDIRIRWKNKLFKSLSLAGDYIFPKRKELIKQISNEFLNDVENFVAIHFSSSSFSIPFYVLREEIKNLQNIAKILTLNTKCFTTTRLQLSRCWDQIREVDKERKKYLEEKKQIYKSNFQEVEKEIEKLVQEGIDQLDKKQVKEKIKPILQLLQTLQLKRSDVKVLKDSLYELEKPFIEKEQKEEEERQQLEKAQKLQKQEAIEAIKGKIQDILHNDSQYSERDIVIILQEIETMMQPLQLTKAENVILKRIIKPVKDLIEQKKEKEVINDDKVKINIAQLDKILENRKQRRNEIKEQLEKCRKALGGSGFDFEKAMMYKEMIDIEKKRLEQANEAVEEIERKIVEEKTASH